MRRLRWNSKVLDIFLFGIYTYWEKLFWFFVNLFPKFIRKLFYKVIFKSFGKNVFVDEGCYFRYPWKILIGNNVTINKSCSFFPSLKDSNSQIQLEDGVILGPNVIFFGAGQDPTNPTHLDISSSIVIGKNTYIGGNSTIRYGVYIGENSTIGAGSVVVSNLGNNSIYAGNPAKFIRKSR